MFLDGSVSDHHAPHRPAARSDVAVAHRIDRRPGRRVVYSPSTPSAAGWIAFSSAFAVAIGCRAVGVDYVKGEFACDVVELGPPIGVHLLLSEPEAENRRIGGRMTAYTLARRWSRRTARRCP